MTSLFFLPILLGVAVWVYLDAAGRNKTKKEALTWAALSFFMPFPLLIIYLVYRNLRAEQLSQLIESANLKDKKGSELVSAIRKALSSGGGPGSGSPGEEVGTGYPELPPAPEKRSEFCSSCGAAFGEGDLFCSGCGRKRE